MKTLFERDDFAASGIGESRKFQRRFVRFRSAVAEKRAHQSARANQLLGENPLRRVIEEIRDVQQRVGFVTQRFDETRMTMAEDVDGDAAEKVPIFFAVGVDEARAFAAPRMKRGARVRAEDECALARFNGLWRFVMQQHIVYSD